MEKAKIDYDKENDSVYLYTKNKAKYSLSMGNFVIDFSSDNKTLERY